MESNYVMLQQKQTFKLHKDFKTRIITNAAWYINNHRIHSYQNIPLVIDEVRRYSLPIFDGSMFFFKPDFLVIYNRYTIDVKAGNVGRV